jgi:penicillin-binding protein 1A
MSRRRLLNWTLWGVLALFVAVLVLLAAALTAAPAVDDLAARVDRFARVHGGQTLPLGAEAPLLREAVVATEDERFYQHHGLDLIGILRAIPYDLSHLSVAQGASSIPEQLAKIVYLGGRDHSPWRKAEDAALALRLGSRYTHEQILSAYLDVVYFGEGSYGAAAASRHYFRRSARDLDLAEASMLAGLVQAPSLYDPANNPAATRRRQIEVLRSMVRNGYVTSSEAHAVLSRPLRLATGTVLPTFGQVGLAPGAPFDWGELALASLLLALAILAAQGARTIDPTRVLLPRLLRLGAVPLAAAALFTAAHSIQVI